MNKQRLNLVVLSILAFSAFSQQGTKTEPETAIFPPEVSDLIYIEAEDAITTNFTSEATMDYSSSGYRTLQLNREPQAAGPFFAEYSFEVETKGSWFLWFGGTPPGPRSDLLSSYISPVGIRVDGQAAIPAYREDVYVNENYTTNNYWVALKAPLELEAGSHIIRFEVSERRRYDTRYYLFLDAFFLVREGSDILAGKGSDAKLPARFPKNLADRSIDNPYLSLAEYETRIQNEPTNRDHYLQLAQVYSLLGDHGNAIKTLSRGRLVAGDDLRFTLLSAKSRVWSGEFDEGLRLYREYLSSPGADPAVWAEAAKMSAWLVRYQDALKLYEGALEIFPEDLNLRVNYGLTKLWAGKVKEGERELSDAWEGSKANVALIVELAAIFETNGYRDKAIAAYESGIKLFPSNIELYLLATSAYYAQNDEAGAKRMAARIVERFPASERLSRVLERIVRNSTMKSNALLRYEERLIAKPDDLDLRRELLRAYFWNDKMPEAAREGNNILVNELYRIFLEMDRDLAETYRLLDILYLHRTYAAALPARLTGLIAGLEKSSELLKRAQTEAIAAAKKKDPARLEKAASALSLAEANLASEAAKAFSELDSALGAMTYIESLKPGIAAEADKAQVDKATLKKLSPWTWPREADKSFLENLSRQGNRLAGATLTRINMFEQKPYLGIPGDQPRDWEQALVLQAQLWSGAKFEVAAFPVTSYFANGAELVAAAERLVPKPTQEQLFSPGTASAANETASELKKILARANGLASAIQGYCQPLLDRANARLRIRLYQHDTESLQDRRDLSDVYLKLGQPAKAMEQLVRILAASPGDTAATFTLGRTMELYGDWHGAMGRYRAAFEQDPKYQSAASSYNRLAKAHGDSLSADLSAYLDTGRTAEQARLDFSSDISSAAGIKASLIADHARIHAPAADDVPEAMNLNTVELSIPINIYSLGLKASARLGGTLQNKLNGIEPPTLAGFTKETVGSYAAVAPRLGASLSWQRLWFALASSYGFNQIADTFFPGRIPYYAHQGDLNVSTYFSFAEPSLLRSLGLRLYAQGQSVFSPILDDTNLRFLGLAEGSFAFLLTSAPWTTLTLGLSASWEDSKNPLTTSYYSPDSVLIAKGGPAISTGIGLGKDWTLGISGRFWAGLYAVPAENALTMDGEFRAELSKRDMRLYLSVDGSRTNTAGNAYWYLQVSMGGTAAAPNYIIP